MKLAELVQTYRLEEDLDDLVASQFERAASAINNSGVEAQLQFLLKAGWTEKQIEAQLTDGDLTLEEEMKCHTTQR